MVVSAQLGSRMHGTGVGEIPSLVGGTSLHAGGRPRLQRLLQSRMAIGDDQQRRRQSTLLQLGEQTTPRGRRLGRSQLHGE